LDPNLSLSVGFAQSLKKNLISRFGRVPSASFVANNFNLRAYETQTITRETARKWLTGMSFPEGGRLKVLAEWLNLDVNEILGVKTKGAAKNVSTSPIKREELFSQKILDALSSQIAVIDRSGQIIQVNKAWRDFALGNAAPADSDFFEKYNYLEVCERARGKGAEKANEMAAGIRSVLKKDIPEYVLKYPCHAPSKKRWFVARVTQMEVATKPYAIITHESVSESNYRKLDFTNLASIDTHLET